MPATAIKERPIPFNAEMVRAILDGRKSQTRRVVNPQPERWIDKYVPSASPEHWLPQGVYIRDPAGALGRGPIEVRRNAPPVRCPYGKPGDRLWVREGFRYWWDDDPPNGTGLYCVIQYRDMTILKPAPGAIEDSDEGHRFADFGNNRPTMRCARDARQMRMGGTTGTMRQTPAMATIHPHAPLGQPHHARNHRGSG
jgi:hypothetical protein